MSRGSGALGRNLGSPGAIATYSCAPLLGHEQPAAGRKIMKRLSALWPCWPLQVALRTLRTPCLKPTTPTSAQLRPHSKSACG